jgi:hypothetical protein
MTVLHSSYQDVLNRLFECIRDGSSPQFGSLLEFVRGGASNQDVTDAVQNSPTTLEGDSENTSPLQNYVKESSSPHNVPIDQKTLLQIQPRMHLPTLDEDKHMDDADFTNSESSLPFGMSEEKKSAQDISSVISKLKFLPKTERELLGRILAEYSSGKRYEAGYSAAQHLHDGFDRDAAVPQKRNGLCGILPYIYVHSQMPLKRHNGYVSAHHSDPTSLDRKVDVFTNCVDVTNAPRIALCAI